MELVLGFAIAVLIAITGVGAGSLIAPLLILFLHVPVAEAVGTAYLFGCGEVCGGSGTDMEASGRVEDAGSHSCHRPSRRCDRIIHISARRTQ